MNQNAVSLADRPGSLNAAGVAEVVDLYKNILLFVPNAGKILRYRLNPDREDRFIAVLATARLETTNPDNQLFLRIIEARS